MNVQTLNNYDDDGRKLKDDTSSSSSTKSVSSASFLLFLLLLLLVAVLSSSSWESGITFKMPTWGSFVSIKSSSGQAGDDQPESEPFPRNGCAQLHLPAHSACLSSCPRWGRKQFYNFSGNDMTEGHGKEKFILFYD